MLIFIYKIFKLFILFVNFFSYVIGYKILFYKNYNKIYYIALLYNHIAKLNDVLYYIINFNNKNLKMFDESKILKFNFIYNIKKNAFSYKIYNYSERFFLLKQFNKIKECSNDLIYDKVIYKHFYMSNIFSYIDNDFLVRFINNFKKKNDKILYKKFNFIFFINKFYKKKKKNINKKVLLKNLFSLFTFNLFIYYLFAYLFIFWLNNLLVYTFYVNDIFLLKILQFNKNSFFYKISISKFFKYKNRKKEYKKKYYFKSIKLNKYYLLYNKFNLLKLNNI